MNNIHDTLFHKHELKDCLKIIFMYIFKYPNVFKYLVIPLFSRILNCLPFSAFLLVYSVPDLHLFYVKFKKLGGLL